MSGVHRKKSHLCELLRCLRADYATLQSARLVASRLTNAERRERMDDDLAAAAEVIALDVDHTEGELAKVEAEIAARRARRP